MRGKKSERTTKSAWSSNKNGSEDREQKGERKTTAKAERETYCRLDPVVNVCLPIFEKGGERKNVRREWNEETETRAKDRDEQC
jgi:hypothetical protein